MVSGETYRTNIEGREQGITPTPWFRVERDDDTVVSINQK